MGFSVSWWLFFVGQLLICVGRSSRPSGGYFALSAYQYAPGVSIRSWRINTLIQYAGGASIRSFNTLIQRINTLTAHQYAYIQRINTLTASVSIRSQRINTLIQRTSDAGVMVTLPTQLRRWRCSCAHSVSRRPHSQRLQTLTVSPDAHNAASTDAHSVCRRPQRIQTPTAYQCAHSV